MIKRIGQILILLLITCWAVSMNSCMNFRKSDKKTLRHFDKKEMPVRIIRTKHKGQNVRFIETGCENDDCPLVLFVHGAPGASDAYFKFLEDSLLTQKAKLVAVDRLGYGYSCYGQAEVSIEEQAAFLETVLQQYNNKSIVLVGHSYGAPIVARYAIDHPVHVKGVLMVAPVNDPESEKVFWFAHLGRWKLTRWMLSKAFRMAADEKFSHIAELMKMEPAWKTITTPVVHIHGKKDKLASFDNIVFSKKHIPTHLLKTVELEQENHLFIFNRMEIVRLELLLLLEE